MVTMVISNLNSLLDLRFCQKPVPDTVTAAATLLTLDDTAQRKIGFLDTNYVQYGMRYEKILPTDFSLCLWFPSTSSGFSEATVWTQAKFYEKLPIPPIYLQTIFVFIFVNMGPCGSENTKTLLLPQFSVRFQQALLYTCIFWSWGVWGIGYYFYIGYYF